MSHPAILTLLGGFLGLDQTSVGQVMVSRPLVASALSGAVLGDVAGGMAVGALLEVYLLVSVPSGGATFPDATTASVVATAVFLETPGAGALPLAVAFGLVWGWVGGYLIEGLRHLNGRLVPHEHTPPPLSGRVTMAHVAGLALDFGRGALATGVGVAIGLPVAAFGAATWPMAPSASFGVVAVGAVASLGILLNDLGGFRARRLLFTGGLALGILGAGTL